MIKKHYEDRLEFEMTFEELGELCEALSVANMVISDTDKDKRYEHFMQAYDIILKLFDYDEEEALKYFIDFIVNMSKKSRA